MGSSPGRIRAPVAGIGEVQRVSDSPPSQCRPVTVTLSLAALRYASILSGADRPHTALCLYSYNRHPLSPGLWRSFPDERAVFDYLLGGDTVVRSLLARQWSECPPEAGWRSWVRPGSASSGQGQSYKLYVSPALASTGAAFADVVRVASESGVTCIKVGRRLTDLVRPDKLVAYFDTFEETAQVAARLAPLLDGLPTQGVPFTCALRDDGMLSWGIDPPASPGWPGVSWRAWLCDELAGAIVRDPRRTVDERVGEAIDHVRHLGVDPDSWHPDAPAPG
jgi:hypothetical protein